MGEEAEMVYGMYMSVNEREHGKNEKGKKTEMCAARKRSSFKLHHIISMPLLISSFIFSLLLRLL